MAVFSNGDGFFLIIDLLNPANKKALRKNKTMQG